MNFTHTTMMGLGTLTPNYRRELQKHSTKKRKCYCLRGGVKLTNCFGPWDYLSLDVPAGQVNQDHISSGNFLLNEIRQSRHCRTTARGSGRCDEMSLGRLGRGEGHLRFRHFESVKEHIRYYRENKPNSLHLSDPEHSKHHNSPVAGLPDELCACCLRPCVKPLMPTQPQQGPPTNSIHHCKCSHHLYRHPSSFPLRATGKAIIPTCASLIMRLPSLELSSESSYWVPVDAMLQKRHTITPTAPYYSYDQNADNLELPSLHRRKISSDKTRPLNSFPPSKKKTANWAGSVMHNSKNEEVCAPENEKTSHEADVSSHETDKTVPAGASNINLTSSGRLLSGRLRSSSSIHSTRPENLKDLVIGTHRSPYDKLISNLAAMSQAKKSMQELYTRRTESASSKRQSGSAQQSKKPSQASGKENTSAEPLDSGKLDSGKGLTLNKLDVMQERSEHEELLADSAIVCGPTIELKTEEMNDRSLVKPFQEILFKPSSSMAITFTKPRTLFRMKSVQRKMRQHTYSDDKNTRNRSRESGTVLSKRGGSHSLYNAKHRLALNKENNGGEEGVFGTRTHQACCAVRSQERMRLRLKTAAASSKRSEIEVRSTVKSSSSGGKKVQVYLIRTTRPLDDILPHLNAAEIHCHQDGTVDLYGE